MYHVNETYFIKCVLKTMEWIGELGKIICVCLSAWKENLNEMSWF